MPSSYLHEAVPKFVEDKHLIRIDDAGALAHVIMASNVLGDARRENRKQPFVFDNLHAAIFELLMAENEELHPAAGKLAVVLEVSAPRVRAELKRYSFASICTSRTVRDHPPLECLRIVFAMS